MYPKYTEDLATTCELARSAIGHQDDAGLLEMNRSNLPATGMLQRLADYSSWRTSV